MMILKNGKIRPTESKSTHNLAYYVVGSFTLAIEIMLGINAAFLIDQSMTIVTQNMLRGTLIEALAPYITLIASLSIGLCFVLGGIWVFGGFMTSLGDARAYQQEYKTKNWPETMVWLLMIAVVLLDLTTLLFRASYFAERGASALFAFFLILVLLPPVLGPLIYVLEHTPRARRLAKMRQFATGLENDDLEHVVKTMDPDLRSRWLEDDDSALNEYYQRLANRENERQQIQAARQQEQAEGTARRNAPLPMPKRPFRQASGQ